jgi:diaminopimelate epimerase
MELQFTKMHGLGNDFVVVDACRQEVDLTPAQIRAIADRRTGIGCDQVLLVAPAEHRDADFRYRIFNANGQEVEHCGNGARCLAVFARDQGLTDKATITLETTNRLVGVRLAGADEISVDMGIPRLAPADIPFDALAQAPVYTLEVAGRLYDIGAASMGNPHAVLRVEDLDSAPLADLGPLIEQHPRFPQGVNVGFMQVDAPDHIGLRVYERGVGETRACGTGACAAVVVGRVQGLLDKQVRVSLPGGELKISWSGAGQHLLMAGPAASVFVGKILL